MNFLSLLTFSWIAVIFAVASPMQRIRTSTRLTANEIAELRARVRGCNANVCFAVDGSGSINKEDFEAELDFVLDIVSIITVDEAAVELAAVQYGVSSSPIKPLSIDFEDFILKVEAEKRDQLKSPATFVAAGLNYCFSQLFSRLGEANKIVLLGDGRSNIGPNAIRRADDFRTFVNGTVCTVGAGFQDDTELLAIAGGDSDRVFQVNRFLDVLKLKDVIEAIVIDICELD